MANIEDKVEILKLLGYTPIVHLSNIGMICLKDDDSVLITEDGEELESSDKFLWSVFGDDYLLKIFICTIKPVFTVYRPLRDGVIVEICNSMAEFSNGKLLGSSGLIAIKDSRGLVNRFYNFEKKAIVSIFYEEADNL